MTIQWNAKTEPGRKLRIKSRDLPRRFGRWNPPKELHRLPDIGWSVAVQQARAVKATVDALKVGDFIRMAYNDGHKACCLFGTIFADNTIRLKHLMKIGRPTEAELREMDALLAPNLANHVDRNRLEVGLHCTDATGGSFIKHEAFLTRHIQTIAKRLN